MLYELIGIVRPGKIAEVKEIARTAGSIVLNSNGVVRGITNWGVFALPKAMPNRSEDRQHTQGPGRGTEEVADKRAAKYTLGHYFVMRFDASARCQHMLRKTWNKDPRLLRFSVVRLGYKLDEVADVSGHPDEWRNVAGALGKQHEESAILKEAKWGQQGWMA
ncbi:hypothetical protein EJ06DRAFT_512915 [Trichodelitschia bisporula]|uniref:Ribosomal protein S6 n=1 Tax=Trichodelitschia bisporula TaxID=703511 RepID=A0A6G1HS24_9PEZI|nr:hypothetical protein EJ06DRAFT_512915 [Trichodelitschia bisporula]